MQSKCFHILNRITNSIVFVLLWIDLKSEIEKLEDEVRKMNDEAEKVLAKGNETTPRTKTGLKTGDIVSKAKPTAETTNADAINDPKETIQPLSVHKEKELGTDTDNGTKTEGQPANDPNKELLDKNKHKSHGQPQMQTRQSSRERNGPEDGTNPCSNTKEKEQENVQNNASHANTMNYEPPKHTHQISSERRDGQQRTTSNSDTIIKEHDKVLKDTNPANPINVSAEQPPKPSQQPPSDRKEVEQGPKPSSVTKTKDDKKDPKNASPDQPKNDSADQPLKHTQPASRERKEVQQRTTTRSNTTVKGDDRILKNPSPAIQTKDSAKQSPEPLLSDHEEAEGRTTTSSDTKVKEDDDKVLKNIHPANPMKNTADQPAKKTKHSTNEHNEMERRTNEGGEHAANISATGSQERTGNTSPDELSDEMQQIFNNKDTNQSESQGREHDGNTQKESGHTEAGLSSPNASKKNEHVTNSPTRIIPTVSDGSLAERTDPALNENVEKGQRTSPKSETKGGDHEAVPTDSAGLCNTINPQGDNIAPPTTQQSSLGMTETGQRATSQNETKREDNEAVPTENPDNTMIPPKDRTPSPMTQQSSGVITEAGLSSASPIKIKPEEHGSKSTAGRLSNTTKAQDSNAGAQDKGTFPPNVTERGGPDDVPKESTNNTVNFKANDKPTDPEHPSNGHEEVKQRTYSLNVTEGGEPGDVPKEEATDNTANDVTDKKPKNNQTSPTGHETEKQNGSEGLREPSPASSGDSDANDVLKGSQNSSSELKKMKQRNRELCDKVIKLESERMQNEEESEKQKKKYENAFKDMKEKYENVTKRCKELEIQVRKNESVIKQLEDDGKKGEKEKSANEKVIRQLQSQNESIEQKQKEETKRLKDKLKASEDRVKEKESTITSYQLQLKQSKTEFHSQSYRLENVSRDLEKFKQREKEARDGMNNLLYHNKERDAYFRELMAFNDIVMAENKKIQAEIVEARNMEIRYFQAIDEKTRANEELWEKVNVYKGEMDKAIESEKEASRQLQLAKNELGQRHLRLTEMEKTIKSLKDERDDLQTRLSSFAGDKLTAGNPAITDLGDSKRPMKIGEMYGELYDNEWTDAMEVTDTVKKHFPDKKASEIEEIIIHHLHRILTTCYQGCLQTAKKQVEDIAAILGIKLSTDKVTETELNKLQGIMTHRSKIAGDFAKKLVAEKAFCDSMLNDWDYQFKNEDVMDELTSSTFYEKCLAICWYMVIQNPVMCLDDEIPPGTAMNKDIYREFTKSGDKVVYVVWPALFLHKDGPVLYKGVVQVK